MVVTFDRECCDLYKKAIDEITEDPEMSAVVMSVNSGEDAIRRLSLDRDAEEKLLDRFRDPTDPLKLLIVTSKLLTGFDAPILQAQYLDKPMKDHNLLQCICRTNRVDHGKSHGLIVDYIGIFDDVAKALAFDEKAVQARHHESGRTEKGAARASCKVPGVLPQHRSHARRLRRAACSPRSACPTTRPATNLPPSFPCSRDSGKRCHLIHACRLTKPTTAGWARFTSP